MSKELIELLRDLANCRHDDFTIGYEAADHIEELERECDQLRDQEKMLRDAIRSLLKAHRVTVSRSVPDTVMEAERILDLIRKAVAKAEEALAATEPRL